MQFGVFDHIEYLPGVSLEDMYLQRLEQIELIDQSGFYGYHLAEHHTPAVHSMAPSQNVFLSAVSQRTKRLRLTPTVYVLPLHHPLRLIEEISMLDNISNGRLEVGVGRGGVLEAYFWGSESDEPSNQLRYDETLDVVLQGLSSDELNYEGRLFHFDRVPMRLRPKQRPYPPLWYMRNAETSARQGMNCIIGGSLDDLEANVVRYRRLWAEQWGEGSPTPQGSAPKIGLIAHIILAPTDAEAVELGGPAWEQYRVNLSTPRRIAAERASLSEFANRPQGGGYTSTGPKVERWAAADIRAELDAGLSEEEVAARSLRRKTPGGLGEGMIACSPETMLRYMEEYQSTNANYFLCSFQFGNLTHAQAMRSVELFATRVMPRFGA